MIKHEETCPDFASISLKDFSSLRLEMLEIDKPCGFIDSQQLESEARNFAQDGGAYEIDSRNRASASKQAHAHVAFTHTWPCSQTGTRAEMIKHEETCPDIELDCASPGCFIRSRESSLLTTDWSEST